MRARSNLLASNHRHHKASVCTAPSWATTHAPPTRRAHKSRHTLTVPSSTQCTTASAHTLPSSNPCSSPSRASTSFRPLPPLPSSTLSPKPPKPLASQSPCTNPSSSLSQRAQDRFLCSPPRTLTTRCCMRCKGMVRWLSCRRHRRLSGTSSRWWRLFDSSAIKSVFRVIACCSHHKCVHCHSLRRLESRLRVCKVIRSDQGTSGRIEDARRCQSAGVRLGGTA